MMMDEITLSRLTRGNGIFLLGTEIPVRHQDTRTFEFQMIDEYGNSNIPHTDNTVVAEKMSGTSSLQSILWSYHTSINFA